MAEISRKPTLRIIAEAAKVSPTTVSLALRNHPRISEETRQRVQAIAREYGYRPDPEVQRLMAHLRTSRSKKFQGSIYGLSPSEVHRKDRASQWRRLVLKGAQQRASELGFSWSEVGADEFRRFPQRVIRVLRARGAKGLFIPPLPESEFLPEAEGWGDLSVVAASYSLLCPRFRRVVPNQFGNIFQLCAHLAGMGYRRMGLSISPGHNERTGHRFAGGYAAFHLSRGWPMPGLYLHETYHESSLIKWVRKESIDVVITSSEYGAELVREDLRRNQLSGISVAVLALEPKSEWTGIDERPLQVGIRAIELLGGMILQNEQGIPQDPTEILIDGILRKGTSAVQRT
jgi:DNA-binding LacI/PurR family transcriptional regulator